jgi:hypothetical protein
VRFNSLLMAPAEDRVLSLARQLALDLADTPAPSRDSLLQRYSRTYGAAFYLFESRPLTQVGGPVVDIPEPVMEEIRRPPPRQPGPPPRRDSPPEDDADRPPPPQPPGDTRATFEVSTGNPTFTGWARAFRFAQPASTRTGPASS